MTTSNNVNAEEKPDGETTADNAPDGKQSEWESERAELIARRDSANKKAREAAKELDALRQKLAGFEKQSAEESGDVNKIREQFQKELETERTKAKTLEQRLRNSVIKNAYLAEASKHFVDKSIDQVWRLLESDFDLEQDDSGSEKIVVKNSALSFGEYLKRFADENDYLAKNPGKNGTATRNNNTSDIGGVIPRDFYKWDQQQQSKWMAANPEAAKKIVKDLGF